MVKKKGEPIQTSIYFHRHTASLIRRTENYKLLCDV